MKIVENGVETLVGPPNWFAGNVYIDPISAPSPTSRVMGGVVHFAPGARTAWHTHPAGQTILVTEGISLVQREGGAVEQVRPGDRVHIEPGASPPPVHRCSAPSRHSLTPRQRRPTSRTPPTR